MTRINVVPPKELHDRHLVAEYHELPRIFGLVRKAIAKGMKPEDFRSNFPKYTMGTGHVKFFYGRLKFIAERQIELISEMVNRKMRPQYESFTSLIAGIPKDWFEEWTPSEEDMEVNRKRLSERLIEMKVKQKRKPLTPYNEHLMDEKGEVRE
jgi:deoxyribonuclease (pyrimidine dimer)